jgi:hypothetical protein
MQTDLRKLTVAWPLAIILLLPALTRADTAGQAWVQRYNGPANGNNEANAVAVDGSNNVIVTGTSCNGVDHDYATIQYSSAGVPLWTNRYHQPGNYINCAGAIAVDGSHNVIVTGYSSNGTNSDYATIKYSSAGAPVWTNRYNESGNGNGWARAVAVDSRNRKLLCLRLRNDQVFERGRAALDQPLQRAGERR